MKPRDPLAFWLCLATVMLSVLLTSGLPILDEESYLDIAGQFDPAHPYSWARAWPPWDADDSFVYAHPPLFLFWVWGVSRLGAWMGLSLWGVKSLAGALWAAILGREMVRLGRHIGQPFWVWATWIACPAVWLVLGRGLMPDLMLLALGVLCISSAIEKKDRLFSTIPWWCVSGVALGLAGATKYPGLLAAVPLAMVLHSRPRADKAFRVWWVAGLVWGGIECWLWLTYGRLHLWEVLSRANEIPRGTLSGRVLGMFVRMGLVAVPIWLFLRPKRALGLGVVCAAILVVWGTASGTAIEMQLALGLWALGSAAGLVALMGVGGRDNNHRKAWLGWALAWMLAVALGHNFAAPRYLVALTIPVAVLAVKPALRRARWLLPSHMVVGCVLGAILVVAEHRYAEAGVQVAQEVVQSVDSPGWFSGEWTFRWSMQGAGWRFLPPNEAVAIAAGEHVATVGHASPGEMPANWTATKTFVSDVTFPVRVACAQCSVGLYGETIGLLPVGWGTEPMEEATLWVTP